MTVSWAIRVFGAVSLGLCLSATLYAQWGTQGAPFPVESPEISAQIKARDIGDSRLTTRYYEFTATQGDLFVNLVATNFVGDIDFFAASNLKPLAKITILGGADPWETGRLIYFREVQKILVRIEGRSPNDDTAVLRIKFAGSFQASARRATPSDPEPAVRRDGAGGRVTSVGELVAEAPESPRSGGEAKENAKGAAAGKASPPPASEPTPRRERANAATTGRPSEGSTAETGRPAPVTPIQKSISQTKPAPASKKSEPSGINRERKAVVLLRGGRRLSFGMGEVVRVSVEEGFLVINQKSGSLLRLPLSEVEEFSIR